ncbi:MAG: hemerythrin domain-containing protein [Motiliproteus sp.]
MPVIWQDAMSVGNIIIDAEHKYLFCLINSVEIALKLDDNERIMKMLIYQLEEYTTDHFRREETVQIKMKYPGYLEHKLEHQHILDNIAALKLGLFASDQGSTDANAVTAAVETEVQQQCETLDVAFDIEDYDPYATAQKSAVSAVVEEQTISGGAPTRAEVFNEDVVALLRSWILDHVLKTDMKMRKHLARFPENFA